MEKRFFKVPDNLKAQTGSTRNLAWTKAHTTCLCLVSFPTASRSPAAVRPLSAVGGEANRYRDNGSHDKYIFLNQLHNSCLNG